MSQRSEAGHAALLSGRLDEARELLESVLADEPDNDGARLDLAWACYRANDFGRAAELAGGLPGFESAAAKLLSFKDEPPYDLSGPDKAMLPFALTDPLPVVQIGVEGVAVHVLIDSGGAELILDDDFAAEVETRTFGSQEGTFAGGKKAPYGHGRVEQVTLGEMELRRVPVMTLPTRRFSPVTGGRYRIDGVIGTNLLAQFRSTLDYPEGKLLLERPGALEPIDGVEVPFLTYKEHYMVSDQGWLNGVGPLTFFVDSGLAGGAFMASERTLERAGIDVPEVADRGGVGGGGGPVKTGVFQVDELGLGPLRQSNLIGIYMEREGADAAEARWDGLISHGFLRKYRWTIDAARSVFVFQEP